MGWNTEPTIANVPDTLEKVYDSLTASIQHLDGLADMKVPPGDFDVEYALGALKELGELKQIIDTSLWQIIHYAGVNLGVSADKLAQVSGTKRATIYRRMKSTEKVAEAW